MLRHIGNHKILRKAQGLLQLNIEGQDGVCIEYTNQPPVRGMRECSHFKTNQGSYAQLTAAQNIHYDDAFKPCTITQAQLGGHGRPRQNIYESNA